MILEFQLVNVEEMMKLERLLFGSHYSEDCFRRELSMNAKTCKQKCYE